MRLSVRNKNLKRLQKYLNKKGRRGRRKQRSGFLNRYDFACAGSDTVNKAMKGLDTLALKLINQDSKEIDKTAEATIRQVINSSKQQIQKIQKFKNSKICTTNYLRSYRRRLQNSIETIR